MTENAERKAGVACGEVKLGAMALKINHSKKNQQYQ